MSSPGAERGLSFPVPPALARCSKRAGEAAAYGEQPVGSCSKAGAQTEVKINNAANKSKRNHWHTARLCPGLGLGTPGCSLLVPGLAAACCQRPAGTGAALGSAPGPGHAQPSGMPLPGSSLASSAVFAGVRGGGGKGVKGFTPGGKGSGDSQGSSSQPRAARPPGRQ